MDTKQIRTSTYRIWCSGKKKKGWFSIFYFTYSQLFTNNSIYTVFGIPSIIDFIYIKIYIANFKKKTTKLIKAISCS